MDRIDLRKVKRYSIKKRYSKVDAEAFARPEKFGKTGNIFDLVPGILGGKDIRNLVKSVINAGRLKKPVVLMMGAHPIKCGLSPLIIDLIKKGCITAVACNGACLVHDFELAFLGRTSEEVADAINDGSFGMGMETGKFINCAAAKARSELIGIGQAFGRALAEGKMPNPESSIFLQAVKSSVPVTVHVAIGTDIYFQHPECSGADWGSAGYQDFLNFCDTVSRIGGGGVVINLGSAVIMPEIFLKALSVSRNLGYKVKNFTTANFDMIKHYRSVTNVVQRPVLSGGKGYNFIGQHELLFPLLYYGLINEKN